MTRKLLLIGNTNGLGGVKVDIENYKNFFKSLPGGQWEDSEIEIQLNPSKLLLDITILSLKATKPDFLVIVFSGHGGQERELLLELNASHECIEESRLQFISQRQINIYDCCRCVSEPLVERKLFEQKSKFFSQKDESLKEKYNKRIMQAIPQQISLYSCAIGEGSNDTAKGGLYTIALLDSATSLSSLTEYKLVGDTHSQAAEATTTATRSYPKDRQQHPEAVIPKCLSSQQLIFSINPHY